MYITTSQTNIPEVYINILYIERKIVMMTVTKENNNGSLTISILYFISES